MITIRPYEEKDYEDMHFICLNADGPDEVPEEKLFPFFLSTYCDYYIEHEPENCFVLDSDKKAVGYIIATENYDKFKKIFNENYLPRVEKIGGIRYQWAIHSTDNQEKVKEKYPAHLHINILPEFQRMGYGSKLIDTLISHFKKKGIKGLCLTCGGFNKSAIKFYKKYGFDLLEYDDDKEYLFGINL